MDLKEKRPGQRKQQVLEAGAYSSEASVATGEADEREMRTEEQFNLLLCSSGKKKDSPDDFRCIHNATI